MYYTTIKMENIINYTSDSDYSTINDYSNENILSDDDYISSENSIVYYVWNNMYDLEHCINYEYINHDDESLVLRQYINIMSFLDEIS